MPTMVRRKLEYLTRQPTMKFSCVPSNFHGCITRPMRQVITPPVLKLIRRGYKFEKSFAGDTIFAATFTFNVASTNAMIAMAIANGDPSFARTATGSQIGWPKMAIVAVVTAMAMNEYAVIARGRLIACPRNWSRWLFEYRVK